MSMTKSIITGARPAAIRGGRMRKRGSHVVSFAPHFADLLSGASRVALGGVLILTGVAALAPTSAMAATCDTSSTTILCSDPADPNGEDTPIDITVSQPGTTIETEAGFGIDSSEYSGPAINLTADNDANIVFVDDNASSIRGTTAGISATNTGDGNTSITTDGVITSTLANTGVGIVVTSSGSGDASVTAGGSVSGDRGILVRGTTTSTGDLGITTTSDSSVTSTKTAINAWQYGDGNITITTAGEISSSGSKAIEGWTDGNGNITIDNSAELNGRTYGIIGFNEGADGTEGNVTITNNGAITSGGVGIAGLSQANGTVSITNSAQVESTNEAIRAWHVGAGDIIVDNSGNLTSDGSFGISTFTDDAGNITVINSGEITAITGIHAQHDANGNISITNDNLVTATTGINAIHYGTGTLTVTTEANSVINAVSHSDFGNSGNGINARHYGDGDVVVTTSGTITSEAENAIYAYTDGEGNISVSNDAVLDADDHGIFAFNNAADGTAGNISITNNGAITSGNVGIAGASHADGNVTITNTADIESTNESIRAWHVGAGNIIVDNSGDLTSTDLTSSDSFGISAFTDDTGDISSTNSGNINAAIGMHAQHDADGLIEQTNNGTIDAVVGINSIAKGAADIIAINGEDGVINSTESSIYALHTADGNITITNAGIVTNTIDASDARHDGEDRNALSGIHTGAGDISITNSGTVNAVLIPDASDEFYSSSDGISAIHYGTGNIVIDNSGTINSDEDGIGVDHIGDGNITITNSDDIIAADDGIFATHHGNYDLPDAPATISVTNTGDIQAGDQGIVAQVFNVLDKTNFVDISITNSGTIVAGDDAIFATMGSTNTVGDISITNSGDIAFVDNGIWADHAGMGDINVTNTDTITLTPTFTLENGPDIEDIGSAIHAEHNGAGNITITNSGTINALMLPETLFGPDGEPDPDLVFGFAHGITAAHAGLGDISVSNSGTISALNAIRAEHGGTGDIIIDHSGTITALEFTGGIDDIGAIRAVHSGTGDTRITTSDDAVINTLGAGIAAVHDETSNGDISITNNAVIRGAEFLNLSGFAFGIYASHQGVGTIDITNNGAINDAAYAAIAVTHSGDGDINITNTASISGEDAAIFASTENGDISITNSGTAANTSGNSADTAIFAYADGGTVSITNSGTITGTITSEFTGSKLDPVLNEYVTVIISGNDSFTNTGTWNTAGGTNNFGVGNDIVTNNGTLHGANSSFVGLESFVNNGTLTMANNVAGDTLTTDGNLNFGANSSLIVDIADNNIDNITAEGDIIIDGGTVEVVLAGERRITAPRYTILSGNSVDGEFASDNLQDTAFLDLALDYTDTTVDLTVTKVVDFADVGQTPNQIATGEALDGLPFGNDLIDEMLYLPTADAARTALDQLSGEVHATQHTAMADDSRLPRNAVLNRLQNNDGSTIWGELFFGNGDLDQAKSRNTGSSKRDAWGFILGADAAITDNIVVGLAGSMIKHESDNQLRSNATTSEIETAHLLAYLGAEMGKTRFKLGAGYAWGDVTTARTVSFGRFSDRLTADYDAKLFQAFAELGYRLPLGGGYVEPMANVIYIDTTTDAFTEKGGLAALSAEKRSEKTTLSTLGARFSTAQSGIFSLNGMAGWQHGFGKLTPSSVLNFAGFAGSDSFTIAGAPQSRDAAVLQVEAKLDAGSGMSVGLGYDGILGTAGHDHAAKVSVRVKF